MSDVLELPTTNNKKLVSPPKEFIPNEATIQSVLQGRAEYAAGQVTMFPAPNILNLLNSLQDLKRA